MNNDVFGNAILSFYQGAKNAEITVKSDLFDDDIILVDYLFRDFENMPHLEQTALQLTKGNTLDVGAGAGSHSLWLQNEKNIVVTALDTSAGAIDVCKKRGIRQSICQNFYSHNATYDTILMLMNGSGIIGALANINFFFQHLKKLLKVDGQVLIDSSDLIYLYENENGEYWVDANNGYYGEMRYSLKYKDTTTEPFDWLYLDYNTLQNAALANGFTCELIAEGEHFDYLAKLSLQ